MLLKSLNWVVKLTAGGVHDAWTRHLPNETHQVVIGAVAPGEHVGRCAAATGRRAQEAGKLRGEQVQRGAPLSPGRNTA